jgi:signal transduction histidine kinase
VDERGPRYQLALDIAVAVALMGFGVWVLSQPDANGPLVLGSLLLLPVVLPLFLRRRAPLEATALFLAGVVISAVPTLDQFRCGVALPVALLLVFSLAAREELGRALAGLGLVLAGMLFLGATDQILEGDVLGFAFFSFPLCTGIWAAGRVARSRSIVAEELAVRRVMLERQRERTAELAVEVERIRLASDLDLAARGGVLRVVELAQAGERALSGDPQRARDAFVRIEREGRQSLDEMRGLLGVLRSHERGGHAPRPTLAQIDTLLDEARAGGRTVDLEVEGDRRELPGGVELAAYRALQHALAAVRSDDGGAATVNLRFLAEALELEVRGRPTEGGGADVAVMAARERVTAQGGSFSADTLPVGQRVLRARLPVVAAGG